MERFQVVDVGVDRRFVSEEATFEQCANSTGETARPGSSPKRTPGGAWLRPTSYLWGRSGRDAVLSFGYLPPVGDALGQARDEVRVLAGEVPLLVRIRS